MGAEHRKYQAPLSLKAIKVVSGCGGGGGRQDWEKAMDAHDMVKANRPRKRTVFDFI
jgi:hypothetical protein